MHLCMTCDGWGVRLTEPDNPLCPTCSGHGYVHHRPRPCSRCRGSGRLRGERSCRRCGGRGYLGNDLSFTDSRPWSAPVADVREAITNLRTGLVPLDDRGVYRAVTLATGLLTWSADRTAGGANPAELVASLDDGSLIVTVEGIWHHHEGYAALIVRFPATTPE